MSRPTEVWVRCDCSGSCGDDVRMIRTELSETWTPSRIRCGGCGLMFSGDDCDRLAVLAEAEAARIEREGSDA